MQSQTSVSHHSQQSLSPAAPYFLSAAAWPCAQARAPAGPACSLLTPPRRLPTHHRLAGTLELLRSSHGRELLTSPVAAAADAATALRPEGVDTVRVSVLRSFSSVSACLRTWQQSSTVQDTQDTRGALSAHAVGTLSSPAAGSPATPVVLALDSRLLMQGACTLLLGPPVPDTALPFPPPTNSPQQEQTAPPCFDGVLCSERLGRLGLVPSHLGEEQLLVKLVTLDPECCRLGLCGSGAAGVIGSSGSGLRQPLRLGALQRGRLTHSALARLVPVHQPSGPESTSQELPKPCVMHAGPRRSQSRQAGR